MTPMACRWWALPRAANVCCPISLPSHPVFDLLPQLSGPKANNEGVLGVLAATEIKILQLLARYHPI